MEALLLGLCRKLWCNAYMVEKKYQVTYIQSVDGKEEYLVSNLFNAQEAKECIDKLEALPTKELKEKVDPNDNYTPEWGFRKNYDK